MKILRIGDISDIEDSREEIIVRVRQEGGLIIRGLFDRDAIRSAIPLIHSRLDSQRVSATAEGSRESVRNNFVRWSVGGFSGAQVGNARFMLSLYNPLSSDDIYGFHGHFRRLIEIRDTLRADGKSTQDEDLTKPTFNACRFQLYPAGGGFMLGHRDYVAERTSELVGAPLLQLLIFVTERGRDFTTGGAFLSHNGNVIDLEGLAQSGDVAIYDGNSFHGVRDVDPELPLDTGKVRGRIVALVTLYS